MILISTSRKPSRRTRRFARELSYVLPNALYVPRGKSNLYDLTERAEYEGLLRVVIVGETKGNPSLLRVLWKKGGMWSWLCQAYIGNVSLSVDVGKKPMRVDADGILVEGDIYTDLLASVFGVYEEDASLVLRERGGEVHFLYLGKEVGPRFKIIGTADVPSALRLQ